MIVGVGKLYLQVSERASSFPCHNTFECNHKYINYMHIIQYNTIYKNQLFKYYSFQTENTGKFLFRDLAAPTKSIYCTSQRGALMNRFPVMMMPVRWNFLQFLQFLGDTPLGSMKCMTYVHVQCTYLQ